MSLSASNRSSELSSASVGRDADLMLVKRAQLGDLNAFDELILRHQSTMAGLLHRFARNKADLEDLVQETFVRAWRGLSAWRPDKPLLHWLKRIAVNVGLEFCRKHQRSPFSRLAEPREKGEDPFGKLEDAETWEAVERARLAADEAAFVLSHLDAEDRVLLTLLYLEQMPLQEIASHLGWSKVNAKVRAFRARQRLRKLLKSHGYEDADTIL